MKFLLLFIILTINLIANIKLPSHIVSAQWLSENIDNVKILDVCKQKFTFLDEGYIPNAVFVDDTKVRVERKIKNKTITRLIPSQKDFDKFISSFGISSSDTIIITHLGRSAGNVAGAARLYWQFKVYGYDNVAILDGGNKAWVKDALEELTKEKTIIKKGDFKTNSFNKNILATIDDVKDALKNKTKLLVDTRDLRFHIGLEKRKYVSSYGHIPNSKLFSFEFLVPLKYNTKFLKISKIKEIFTNLGIDYNAPMILYCNSGYEASAVWFALYELIGNKNVSIYDAGLHEYTMDKNNPIVKTLGK